jgi:hypothetical protein
LIDDALASATDERDERENENENRSRHVAWYAPAREQISMTK